MARKILIIEDDSDILDLLKMRLEANKYEVVGAVDGKEGYEKALALRPDVITLDVEMPRMDGITFLHKIMTQHPIPVVMCSTLTVAGSETALKALEYGAVDIIVKPKLGTKQFIE